MTEADAEAEQLIGIVRMLVASALAVAVFFAVQLPDRGDAVAIDRQTVVGYLLLGGYFAVGAAAVVIVRLGRYRPWMAWIFAGFDVLSISLNLGFSLHATQSSSLLTLGFPAAFFIPIILVQGALRYRPELQITVSGLLLAAIALIIVSNPGLDDVRPASMSETLRDSFDGAGNAVRLVLLLIAAGIVTTAVWRARRLLERVGSETEQRANLTRFLPGGVAGQLSDDELAKLRRGRRTEAAIMFLDIRGFTSMSEAMSPEVLSRFLSDFRTHVLDVADRHGGIVDKFVGDGALVLFGVNGDRKDVAGSALKAAIDITNIAGARTSENAEGLRLAVGLHWGVVVVGAIGDDRRLEFTVVGNAVNEASRLEAAAKAKDMALVVSNRLIERADEGVKQAIDWQDLGEERLRGRSETIHLFGLESVPEKTADA